MTTTAMPLTNRIHASHGVIDRIRCAVGLHPWSRWERLIATLKEGKDKREVVVNVRECIACGLSQTRAI